MAKAHDQVKVTGEFHCKVYKLGKLIMDYTDKNLVVQAGRDHIARLLAGASIPSPLTKIGVGSGTSSPALGDTALTPPFFTRLFNSNSYSSPGKAVIAWQIDPAEANGITITEFGLCFGTDALFARKTGVTIVKSGSVSITGTWTITIT